MTASKPIETLRKIAAGLDGLDVDCYRKYARDPLEPVLGLGSPNARWCFFGRDLGEQEVSFQRPFVGDSGKKIRAVMDDVGLPDADVFWMNTVPYKPIKNKAWSLNVRRQCLQPLLQLFSEWQGYRVIAVGEAAFKWFGMTNGTADAEIKQFWKRGDKYESELRVTLELPGAHLRTFTLCAVPHPSAINAKWAKWFPDLLKKRLRAVA